MSRVIKIEQGNELKVLVNSNNIEEKDFFFPQYVEARRHIITIVESSKRMDKFNCDEEYLNNIISFCGERGAGKTTAMKTFAQLLCKQRKPEFFDCFKDIAFYALKSIDPSSFESMHHVLDFIISLMFKDFESIYIKNPDDISNELKYKLLSQFQIVYKNLTALRNPKKYQDLEYDYEGDVQKLSNIASDINLRENLYNLIDYYLEIKGSKYLVLMIDDIDINSQFAYEITEELRRYLNIPNVIVIMAIRMEQLNYCIKKELKKDFKSLIDENKKYNIELNMMVNKYLNKLIPESRRIQLPDLRVVSSDAKDLVEIKYITTMDDSELTSKENETIETTILKYIFNMTDIVFVHEHAKTHPIVPSTLRELVMLYEYLGQMDRKSKPENLAILKRYFLDVWCKDNLNEYTSKIVNDWQDKSLTEKNRFLCEQIKLIIEAFLKKDDEILKNFKTEGTIIYAENNNKVFDLNAYCERQFNEYAFSLGEVLNLLMDVSTIVKNDEVDSLISGCYMMYSILLNQLKENDQSVREVGIMQPDDVNTIIAGSLWGNKLVDLLPNVKQRNGKSITRCRFNYNIIDVLRELGEDADLLRISKFEEEISETNRIFNLSKEDYEKIIKNSEKKLYILGSVSKFGPKSRSCDWRETFLSNNYAIKTNVEFNLDGLFMLGMGVPFVSEKVSYDSSLSISKDVDVDELLSEYGIDKSGSEYIAYNLELSKLILSECLKRKTFSREASFEDELGHYRNLFNCVNIALMNVFKPLEKYIVFTKNEGEKASVYEIISWFYENRLDEDKDTKKYDLPTLHQRRATDKLLVSKLLWRCEVLLKHLDANLSSLDDVKVYIKTLDNIVRDLGRLNVNALAPKYCIDDYNKILTIMKDSYKS